MLSLCLINHTDPTHLNQHALHFPGNWHDVIIGLGMIDNITVIMETCRVPVDGKSSVCVICMKYRIIVLIIIIISLGQIILSYMANTSRTHACMHTYTHAHTRAHPHARPPAAVTFQVVAVRWVGVRPTMMKICPLFACSAGHEWLVGASFK